MGKWPVPRDRLWTVPTRSAPRLHGYTYVALEIAAEIVPMILADGFEVAADVGFASGNERIQLMHLALDGALRTDSSISGRSSTSCPPLRSPARGPGRREVLAQEGPGIAEAARKRVVRIMVFSPCCKVEMSRGSKRPRRTQTLAFGAKQAIATVRTVHRQASPMSSPSSSAQLASS